MPLNIGEGCLLLRVRGLVYLVPCTLYKSKNGRKLEHPTSFTKYGHLIAEDAVKQLKEEIIDKT